MKRAWSIAALGAAVSMHSVSAQDLSPGMWEVTMETQATGDAGWKPPPFNRMQCLTANDAKDPSRLVGSMSVPGATGCTYTERSYSGNTFRFALDCSGSYGIRSKGSVIFSPASFNGEFTATANLAGQSTEFRNEVQGRRVGSC